MDVSSAIKKASTNNMEGEGNETGITGLSEEDRTLNSDSSPNTDEALSQEQEGEEKTSPVTSSSCEDHTSSKLLQTAQGCGAVLAVLGGFLSANEIHLQRRLTCAPTVYMQKDGNMKALYEELSKNDQSILSRPMKPALVIGTRGVVSSTAAYLMGGPSKHGYTNFRECFTMSTDGATIAVDWELPKNLGLNKEQVLFGPISTPIVIVIHGLNNHANYGYVRSMMRACTDRGWIAAGMNLRGCGGVPLSTPRSYNAAYTGDLRSLVKRLSSRMKDSNVPMFLVGNSLSANLVTKYLGEEGLSGSLPKNIAGGAALGNPCSMVSTKANPIFSPLLALGVKVSLFQNWNEATRMSDSQSRKVVSNCLKASTLAQVDDALSPIFQRNDRISPFRNRVGFQSKVDYQFLFLLTFTGGVHYGYDASSCRTMPFINVPMLQLIASDDFLVARPFREKMHYALSNPNILVVETKCGGHLGWQQARPKGSERLSWADSATTDFISVVFDAFKTKTDKEMTNSGNPNRLSTFLDSQHIQNRMNCRL